MKLFGAITETRVLAWNWRARRMGRSTSRTAKLGCCTRERVRRDLPLVLRLHAPEQAFGGHDVDRHIRSAGRHFMGDMGNMGGYGHGGWRVLSWVSGIALLIVLVWFLARRRGGK